MQGNFSGFYAKLFGILNERFNRQRSAGHSLTGQLPMGL